MNISVMIIEDRRDLANTYALMFSRLGVGSDICRDGDTARERIAEGLAPNLVLLDLDLSGVSGEEVLSDIISNREYNGVGITIITDYPDMGLRAQAEFPDRVRRVLAKPIVQADLQEEIWSLRE